MKNYIILTLLILVAGCSSSGSKIDTPPPASTETVELEADFGVELGKWSHKPGSCLSTVYGQSTYLPNVWNQIKDLDLKSVRMWLRFERIYDVANKKIISPTPLVIENYFNKWSDATDTLLLNWMTNYELCQGTGAKFTEQELIDAQVEAISFLKQRWGKIAYIECENELHDMTDNYKRYKLLYRVIKKVNDKNLPGPKIKIGGPVTSLLSDNYMQTWLKSYKDDTHPDKRIDFIAYHEYLFNDKGNVAVVANQKGRVNVLLSEVGLGSLPIYITETGIFQEDKTSGLGFEADLHIQAAGMATMFYYYMNQSQVYPFHWTVVHPNPIKNMFVETEIAGLPRPYYLLMKMQSMMPEIRYKVNNFLDNKGIGVGAMAAGDNTKVAVFSWNYQWNMVEQRGIKPTKIKFKNLPSKFRTTNVKVEQFFVPETLHEGYFRRTINKTVSALSSGEYTLEFTHNPNTLQLTMLTAQ